MGKRLLICFLVIVGLPCLLFDQIKLIPIWLFAGSNRIRLPQESAFQNPGTSESGQLMATELEQEIQRLMPIGTSVREAEKVMRRNGFNCKWTERKVKKRQLHNQSTLFCRRDDATGILVETSWMVFLDYEHELITQIQASTGLTGL